jgi:hypothetical protein
MLTIKEVKEILLNNKDVAGLEALKLILAAQIASNTAGSDISLTYIERHCISLAENIVTHAINNIEKNRKEMENA